MQVFALLRQLSTVVSSATSKTVRELATQLSHAIRNRFFSPRSPYWRQQGISPLFYPTLEWLRSHSNNQSRNNNNNINPRAPVGCAAHWAMAEIRLRPDFMHRPDLGGAFFAFLDSVPDLLHDIRPQGRSNHQYGASMFYAHCVVLNLEQHFKAALASADSRRSGSGVASLPPPPLSRSVVAVPSERPAPPVAVPSAVRWQLSVDVTQESVAEPSPVEMSECDTESFALHLSRIKAGTRLPNGMEFWKQNESLWPTLSKVAMRLLICAGTFAEGERSFSHAGVVASEKRSRLTPVKLNRMSFLGKNLLNHADVVYSSSLAANE